MSAYDSTGQKTAGTIDAQPHDCPHCGAAYEGGGRSPRGRPYCGDCRCIIAGERPEGAERFKLLSYSALGSNR